MEFSTSSAWGVSYETTKLSKEFDIVLIDTPPKADSDLRHALRAGDMVLVPVATSHVDLWATEGVLDLAERAGTSVSVVMNRTRPGTRLSSEVSDAAAEIGLSVLDATLANRVIYAETLGQGQGVQEARKTPARDEVDALAAEVLATLNG